MSADDVRPFESRAARWVKRWDDVIDPKPVAPGIYRRKAGGFRIRGRAIDPRTGCMREVRRGLPDARRVHDAAAILAAELGKIRNADKTAVGTPLPRFADYAAAVFESKVTDGRIQSAAGREKWRVILSAHLLPAFGAFYVDKLTPADIEAWKEPLGARIRAGKASPATGNTVLAVLRVITAAAAAEFDIRDPSTRVRPFDTRGHRTYTDEAPNSLAPVDVPRFLDKLRELYPHLFAFVLLGFVTGLRPSSLRPLRRFGPNADVKWPERVLLVRRSQTRGAEVMESTKTARDQRIVMPPDLVAVLEWHIANLPQRAHASELLFPSTTGGFLDVKALAEPFAVVAKAIGLPYKLTPRGMRRTFQDLAREAAVADVVTRAISGHATETMQRHYSTARDHEITAGLGRVLVLAAPKAWLLRRGSIEARDRFVPENPDGTDRSRCRLSEGPRVQES